MSSTEAKVTTQDASSEAEKGRIFVLEERNNSYGSLTLDSELKKIDNTSKTREHSFMDNETENIDRVVITKQELQHLVEYSAKIQDIITRAVEGNRKVLVSMEKTGKKTRRRYYLPLWLTADFLFFTSLLQIMVIGILSVIDGVDPRDRAKKLDPLHYISYILLTIIQMIHLILVVAATVKLAKQILHHSASFWFLVQCYLSTVLLYAGLYTMVYKFDNEAFKNFDTRDVREIDNTVDLWIVTAFLQGLYLSASTATLCGASQIEAVKLYSTLLVSCQMLLSFVYFASILSQAISPGHPKNEGNPGLLIRFYYSLKKLFDKLRNLFCCCCD